MADNNKPKFDLPWGTLLPLLAVLAGVIATYKPLVSERPSVASEKTSPVVAAQDVDARLWQDPIGVAQKALLDEQLEPGAVKKGATASHELKALTDLLSKRANKFPGRVLLLMVMLDSGPYGEQGESRLRARRAVLEGLSESGFIPADGEHIGFVTANWPVQSCNVASPAVERGLLLPWEECEPITDPKLTNPARRFFRHDTQQTKRIVVLWLPATNFNPNPLCRVAALIEQLAPEDIRDKIKVTLIGPANSTGLQNMVREVGRYPRSSEEDYPQNQVLRQETQKLLDGVSIISPRATASDRILLYKPSSAAVPDITTRALSTEKSVKELLEKSVSVPSPSPVAPSSQKSIKELLEKSVPVSNPSPPRGLHFVRTIATDDVILRELIAELARRRIPIMPQMTPDHRPIPPRPAHVAILSEWDTPYGRSLATSFAAEASGQSVSDIIEHPAKWPRWIHAYQYLRGIDGQLPGDETKGNQSEQGQKNQPGQLNMPIEATEGLNQSDYLRRLAREMKQDNAQWQREDGSGIRAIGLLGSDVYDKLMILRALRPQFRNAVFFTNNYDAHFERRDDWDAAHNLIIASPFGSSLPEFYRQQHIAPFRDGNQTSTYVGTLVATGMMDESEATDFLFWQPRILEIGRRGARDLSPAWYLEGEKLVPSTQTSLRDWLFRPGVIWWLIIVLLCVLAMAAWISVSIARRTLPGGGTAPERLKRTLVSTVFWLVCGGPLVIFVVALIAQYWAPEEPLAFFSGISIWPTEMLRLIAFMLAIFFMFKASFDLRANTKRIEADFSFAPLPLTPFRWRDLGIGFEHWRMRQPPRTSRFSAEEAWHAYLCRNKFWPRFIRIGILFALYSIFAFTILHLFPQPPPPARGEMAFKIDNIVFYLAGIGLLLLSFYVVDAIQLNTNFIRMFGREVTEWGRDVVDRSHRRPPLTEEELSAYNEIFFVAQRTQVIAPLIWYPLVVLTLIVVARASLFDSWTWPPGLVLIFAITAAWGGGQRDFA